MSHARNFAIIFGPVCLIFGALLASDRLIEGTGSLAIALTFACVSLALCIAGIAYSVWLLRLILRAPGAKDISEPETGGEQ